MTKAVSRRFRLIGLILIASILSTASAIAQTEGIPQRSDIDARYKWKLEDIYPDTATWNADFKYVEENYARLNEFEGKLGESSKNLAQCLLLRDALSKKLGSMYVYAFMKYHEDTRVAFYQELQQRIAALDAQAEAASSFIEPEILAIDEKKLKDFLKKDADLKDYNFYINDLIRSKAHILSQKEEAILALAGPIANGPENVFDMIYYADIKFPKIVDDNGDSVQITRAQYSRIMESQDRDYRRRAHKAYNEAQFPYFNTFGATLASQVNTDWFFAQARNYPTCLEYKLDNYNIPTAVYTNLLEAVNANLAPLHKWVALRKKVMELDEVHGYDLNVPLVPEAKKEVLYDEAVQMILKGLQPLGERYVNDLKAGFNGGWIDVYETEGKYSGGYCWGTYTTHPYILMNYNNSLEEAFTLAHEMGHALHRNYSYQNQPYPMGYYTLFVAEVASTVNESIMINHLIKNAQNDDEKLYLITNYIEQILGTFYFQVMFAEFEKKIHEAVENGGALSAESMRQLYTEIWQKFWGSEVVLDEWTGWGGIRVPHFYESFYVYQYATGYTAAQAISKKILAGDTQARDKYLEFLAWGGNDYPVEQLKKIGVDMTKPEVVNATISMLSDLVDQAEALFEKKKKG